MAPNRRSGAAPCSRPSAGASAASIHLPIQSYTRQDRCVSEAEEPLAGGNLNSAVVRVGDTVRRAAGVWTPAVHALLEHLAGVGYPAPRPMGVDEQGREVLSFIPGVAIHPDHLDLVESLRGLRRAALLIADYHDAQKAFRPPPDACWRDNGRDPTGSHEVLAHNDFAPWNLIAGPVWVYIDWDLVAPGRRHWDLAWALHSFGGLWPEAGHSDSVVVERITAFCDAARVPVSDRPALLHTVVERTAHNAAELRRRGSAGEAAYRRMVEEGHADGWERGSRHVAEKLDRWVSLLPHER